MSKLAAHVGTKIRMFRKNRGLTQEQLGEKVQQPQSYLGGIERGEKNISLDTIDKISNALGIRPVDLFSAYPETGRKNDEEKLADAITLLLKSRSVGEIKVILKLIEDVLKVFDSKI
ncbi:helix-turn-helix domain-containing protein [Cohnella boryungensis]|uniref:Helix-turn-helix domain-containing protein n=1 Tax=Cohnella boryungensis TaxID=768479 RepID=A0ABV8SF83_9BACL